MHIPITRKSQCTKVNKTGTKLLEICKLNNLLILNGRLGKDSTIGKFTFRNTSVIDYTISTPQILHQFKEFEIIELDGLYSDGRCLQSMSLQISHKSKQTAKIDQEGKDNCRLPKWKSIKEQEFVNNLNDTKLAEITNMLNNCPNDNIKPYLNDVSDRISKLFIESAKTTFNHT